MPAFVDQKIEFFAPHLFQRVLHLARERVECSHAAGIELERDGLTAHRLDLRDNGVGVVLFGVIGHDNVGAALGDAERHIAAQAATASGDDGCFHNVFARNWVFRFKK